MNLKEYLSEVWESRPTGDMLRRKIDAEMCAKMGIQGVWARRPLDLLLYKIARELADKCRSVMEANKIDNDIVFQTSIDISDWEAMDNTSSLRKGVHEELRELLHGEDVSMILMQERGRIQIAIHL